MSDPARIPLFPLDVVLFPGTPLPLHIFEPRYREMVRHCLDEKKEFGVVLARQDGIAAVGCTAEILEVVKRYPDGRMDILTAGRNLYRLLEVFEELPYLEGQVEYLEDDLAPASAAVRDKLAKAYAQCYTLLFGRSPQPLPPGIEVPLSYHIASELPLDLESKQELLEALSEAEREERLLEQIQHWLPQLTHMNRVRKKAGGNGHGLGGKT